MSFAPLETSPFDRWVRRGRAKSERRARQAARGAGLPSEESEDVYSDAMEVILRDLEAGRRIHNFDAYFHQVARFCALQRKRRRNEHRLGSLELYGDDVQLAHGRADGTSPLYADEPLPEEQAERRWDATMLREVIEELTHEEQAITRLRFDFGLTYAEVGDYLDLSEDQVKKRIKRAQTVLAKNVGRVRSGSWCAARRGLLTRYALGDADGSDAAKAKGHIAVCSGCRRLVRDLRAARLGLPALIPLPLAGAPSRLLEPTLGFLDQGRETFLAAVLTLKKQLYDLAARLPLSPRTGAEASAVGVGGGVVKAVAVSACVGGGAAVCITALAPIGTFSEERSPTRTAESSERSAPRLEPPATLSPRVPTSRQSVVNERRRRRLELIEEARRAGVAQGRLDSPSPEHSSSSGSSAVEEFGIERPRSSTETSSSAASEEFGGYGSATRNARARSPEGSRAGSGSGGSGSEGSGGESTESEFGFER